MSMLDSFFNKGFKASKCKTLLKLTIPRIKLLRNRREAQIKQMRHDIAKLLETGQEATARIRVEHIIREERMMAAQEIVELFSELISVRLPIIEAQRECPLDLKEAISSLCFAAPRCADLPELQQVQLLLVSKYGREFVAAATELRPDCGVNRKLIELLSIRAPSPDEKLKLLKEIAEEHELDWDPAATETEFSKSHEDLLHGSNQFDSGSKLPLPEEKKMDTTPGSVPSEHSDADTRIEMLAFPEVPQGLLLPRTYMDTPPTVSSPVSDPSITAPEVGSPFTDSKFTTPDVDLNGTDSTLATPAARSPFKPVYTPTVTAPTLEEVETRLSEISQRSEDGREESSLKRNDEFEGDKVNGVEKDQSVNAEPYSSNLTNLPPVFPKTNSSNHVDLQEILTRAKAAADTAERAAAEARSAASLAESHVAQLTMKDKREPSESSENPFHTVTEQVFQKEEPSFDHQDSLSSPGYSPDYIGSYKTNTFHSPAQPDIYSFEKLKLASDTTLPGDQIEKQQLASHHPQRLPSMDEEPYFSYPNLFGSQHQQYPEAGSHAFGTKTTHSDNL